MGSDRADRNGAAGSADRASRSVVRRVRELAGGAAGKASASAADVAREKGYQIHRFREGHSQIIGYARVSTQEQKIESQLDELRAAGCSRVFAEKISSIGHRPGWAALMGEVRKGDVLTVVRLDRIGRKLSEVVGCCDALAAEGVYVRALAQQIDTRTREGRMLLPLWSALAETERSLIVERTIAGLEAARARGKNLGRPTVITPARIDLCETLRAQKHSLQAIAEATGLGEGTVRKILQLAEDRRAGKDGKQLRLEGA
jgi:DNA invertase Pin-like site-specific DNA recombinase